MSCETTNSEMYVKKLENDKIELQSEIVKLKQDLRTQIGERYSYLTEEVNYWKNTVMKDLEKHVHDLIIEGLEKQVHELKLEKQRQDVQIHDLGVEKNLQKDCYERQINSLKNDLKICDKKVEFDQLKSANNVFQTQITQLQADNDIAFQHIEKLQVENDVLKSKVSDLTKKLSILEHECIEHNTKQTVLMNENNDLSNKIKEFAANLLKSETSQICLNEKISDLEIDLQTQTKFFENEKFKFLNTIKSLQEQIESFKHIQLQNNHLKSANIALRNKITDLNDKCLQKESNELILKDKISNLEDDLQTQAQFFEEEKVKLPSRAFEKRFNDLKHELENKKTIFASKEKRFLKIITNLESYHSSLEKKLDTLKASSNSSSCPKTNSPESSSTSTKVLFSVDSDLIDLFKTQFEKEFNSKSEKDSQKATSQVNVPHKIYPSKYSKPFSKKVSQFTTYSLHKAKKYSESQYSSGTLTSSSFLSFSDNSSFISNARNRMKNREWNLKSKVSSSSTHTKSFKYTFTKLFELAPIPVGPIVQKVNDFVFKNPTQFKTPSSFTPLRKTKDFSSPLLPQKLFSNETSSLNSRWNAMSIHQIDQTYIFSKVSKIIGPVLKWVPKIVTK